MSETFIEVRSLTLRELFSGSYVFHLPWFQRAYAWQTEQVACLLDDLLSTLEDAPSDQKYFLGTLLICKPNAAPDTALIDGHQRTMTLTILFSVLRDLCTDRKTKVSLRRFIKSPDFHLQPQDLQADFCRTYVQQDNATSRYPDDLIENLSITERNILTNRDFIKERLSDREIGETLPMRLAEFLGDRCHVILHQAPNEDEAWARLRKEEETRLDFSSVDLAKASLLSIVPTSDRGACAQVWEQIETLIGPVDLYCLLGHLHTLKRRTIRNKPLEEQVAEAFNLNRHGLKFMREIFLPAAQRMQALRNGTVGTGQARERIARHCQYMSWIDMQSWLPAALIWLERRGAGDADTVEFFARLERLVWIIKLTPEGSENLQPRLMRLVKQVEKGTQIDAIEPLKIERKLKNKLLEKLRAQYFDRRSLRTEAMRRIAAADGQDPGPVEGEKATLEHILPRGWKLQNSWRTPFPDRQAVDGYAHRLGNLTYLNRIDNHKAASEEFAVKKKIYAKSEFRMTQELASEQTWLRGDIEARTERLIAALFADWKLTV